MCAQDNVNLAVNVEPFRVVVQFFCLQSDSGHEPKGPTEVLEMELFEDGISPFHFIPPYGFQVWQQLLPLISA